MPNPFSGQSGRTRMCSKWLQVVFQVHSIKEVYVYSMYNVVVQSRVTPSPQPELSFFMQRCLLSTLEFLKRGIQSTMKYIIIAGQVHAVHVWL